MTNAERALAWLEACTPEEVARLCGADRILLQVQLQRLQRLLDAAKAGAKAEGVLGALRRSPREG